MKIGVIIVINFLGFLNLLPICSSVLAQTTNWQSSEPKTATAEPTSFRLDKIKVYGYTVFSSEEISNLVTPYLKKNLSFEQSRQIIKKITDLYVSNGYLTSGAFFPEQEITDSTAVIKVIEGKLERVEATGLKNLTDDYLYSRLQWDNKTPLNIRQLQKNIQLLQQEPLIRKIDAKLVAGSS